MTLIPSSKSTVGYRVGSFDVAAASVGWPVIFWQRRIGLHGRTIFVYKFKTMRNPIDGNGRRLTLYERQTRIGKFLRATRLDELPQLINIIQGNMAVIGPRPLLPVDQPAEASLRLAVAPGITGWAQINGGKLISAEEKSALDEWYAQRVSPTGRTNRLADIPDHSLGRPTG